MTEQETVRQSVYKCIYGIVIAYVHAIALEMVAHAVRLVRLGAGGKDQSWSGEPQNASCIFNYTYRIPYSWNNFFSSCFNSAVSPLTQLTPPSDENPPNYCPDDFLCTEEEVATLIHSLDVSIANGPDGISAKMLKGTLSSIVPFS